MTATLLVLGASACAPTTYSPTVGYAIVHPGGLTLIDCGPGVINELARRELLDRLTSVVISHRHADHCADLAALGYRRCFPAVSPPLPLIGPTGFGEVLDGLNDVFGIPTLPAMRAPYADRFEFQEVTPGASFTVDGLDFDSVRADHPVPTLSLRVPSLGLVYTADTGYTSDLVKLAEGADVLLAEATYRAADGIDVSAHGHLTGTSAGQLAAAAGVRTLVLTHFADPQHRDDLADEAAAEFGGEILLAATGLEIPLAPR